MSRLRVREALRADWQLTSELMEETGLSKYALKQLLATLVERGEAERSTDEFGRPRWRLLQSVARE